MARSNTANTANWFSRASASGLTAFPVSMSCWFYPFNLTSTSILMAVSDAGATSYSALLFDGANAYARGDNVVLMDHGFPGNEAVAGAVAAANTWNHACSVDASNTSHIAYLNGVAGTTNTFSQAPASYNHIDVGALRSTTTTFSPLDGRIAEVAFWSKALTADEVLMLSKGVSPLMIRPNDLNRYWPLIRGGANEIDRILREVLVQNGTMGQVEHVRQFYPVGPVLSGLGTAGGATNNLLANDVLSASSVSQPAIHQTNVLLANDVLSASSVSQPAIHQTNVLLANDVLSASSVSKPAITNAGTNALLANDVLSASSVSHPVIGQKHIILANDVVSASSVSKPTIHQTNVLLANDIISASSVSHPALSSNGLSAEDIVAATFVSKPTLGQIHAITAKSIIVPTLVGNPRLRTPNWTPQTPGGSWGAGSASDQLWVQETPPSWS